MLSARFRWITIGMFLLILLTAFESLAIETVMPAIASSLHGTNLYSLAFSGPFGMGVVGMVASGIWSDRGNPRLALYAATAIFVVGLGIAGSAQSMWFFVIGRLAHGLGGGAIIVALYVIVARLYPARLHPSIFAGFAAAWVLPSLIGPLVAAIVTQTVGWRWVYAGVIVLVGVVMALVVPSLRTVRRSDVSRPEAGGTITRIACSVAVAVAILVLSVSAEFPGAFVWIASIGAAVVLVVALRPLLPRSTLTAARGLASVILLRGVLSGAFAGTQAFIPYLLSRDYHLSPTVAGIILSIAALSWSAASWAQGRFSRRITSAVSIRLGVALVTVAIAVCLVTAIWLLSPVFIIVGWVCGGAGMGFAYPRINVLTLADSTASNQGFNSSALTISDSTGAAFVLALTALALASLSDAGGAWPVVGVFALTLAVSAVGLWIAPRSVARG